MIDEIREATSDPWLFDGCGERWLFGSDGIAGCGKTSAAYVTARALGCDDFAIERIDSRATPGDRSKAAHALESARGPLQSAVARNLRTRMTPRLEFHYDASAEKAQEIHAILDRLALERAEKEAALQPPDETERS